MVKESLFSCNNSDNLSIIWGLNLFSRETKSSCTNTSAWTPCLASTEVWGVKKDEDCWTYHVNMYFTLLKIFYQDFSFTKGAGLMSNTYVATKAILFEVRKNESSTVKSTVPIFLFYRSTQDPQSTFVELIWMWFSFGHSVLPKSMCLVEYWGKQWYLDVNSPRNIGTVLWIESLVSNQGYFPFQYWKSMHVFSLSGVFVLMSLSSVFLQKWGLSSVWGGLFS